MTTLQNYHGLEIPSSTPGAGGAAISDNFQNLVDWNPLSTWNQTASPTASDDQTQNYYPGSFWLNISGGTNTGQLYMCTDSTTGAAVWLPVMRVSSNGAITVPDASGATAGNARGNYAVDLQAKRNSSTQVASGQNSVAMGGYNSASGSYSVAIGNTNNTGGNDSVALGILNGTGGGYSISMGGANYSSGSYSAALGGFNHASGRSSVAVGYHNLSNHNGELSFGPNGKSWQSSALSAGVKTTTATQTELTMDGNPPNSYSLGANPNTNRLLLEEKTYACTATITARQSGGSNVAMWRRQFMVSVDTNDTGTLSVVQTIGTDIVPNGWSSVAVNIALVTNGTSGNPNVLQVLVTGLASTTINWAATIEATIITTN
jgi:hypothetical protein